MNKNTEYFRTNEQIRSDNVRIVGENVTPGVYPLYKAIKMATDLGTDLVEINRNANPPVCKIIDLQKFLYERKKKQKDNEKNQFQQKVKELRFSPVIGDHDYNFKVKQGIDFLKEKHKLQISIFFQGRMITHLNLGYELIKRLTFDLESYGKLENKPKMEGKRMVAIFQPK